MREDRLDEKQPGWGRESYGKGGRREDQDGMEEST